MAEITDARKSALAHEVRASTTWEEVFRTLDEWQQLQFPGGTAASGAKHLLKEAKELVDKPEDGEEWVDALHLVLQGASKVFPDHHQFFEWFKFKLEKNIWRVWQEPDADGVVEHVRGDN